MFGRTRQLKDPGKKPGGGWVSKNASQKSGQGTARSAAAWKQDTLEGLEKGSRVWYKAGVNSWVLGTLLTRQEESWKVALDSEAGEATGQVDPALHAQSTRQQQELPDGNLPDVHAQGKHVVLHLASAPACTEPVQSSALVVQCTDILNLGLVLVRRWCHASLISWCQPTQ